MAEAARRDPGRTREALVEAALTTLKEEGYAGTTARAIASRAGVNQALVFYHFGGVHPLLLAALDRSAKERLEQYRSGLASATTLEEKVAAAERLYREDVERGHITVLSELLAASLAEPELGPELVARLRPWLELTEEELAALPVAAILRDLVPLRQLAFVVVALYLGLELLSRLDAAGTPVGELFDLMRRVTALLDPP